MIIAETTVVINAEFIPCRIYLETMISGIVNTLSRNVKSSSAEQIMVDTMATVG